jgi:hypothetical protein
MARQKSAEPRTYLRPGGVYPFGPFVPETPSHVLASAVFALNLRGWMRGQLSSFGKEPSWIVQDRSLSTFVQKFEISHAVISRIRTGAGYPDMLTVARLEELTKAELWGSYRDWFDLLEDSYHPSKGFAVPVDVVPLDQELPD